jgi:hypothetical protein
MASSFSKVAVGQVWECNIEPVGRARCEVVAIDGPLAYLLFQRSGRRSAKPTRFMLRGRRGFHLVSSSAEPEE